MATVKDHFIDLERHRRQLEENVAKLQRALQHWRMCDAEYEQLKDEVEAISEPTSRDDLGMIREEFEGEVVTDKEVEELFGKSNEKSTKQIVSQLSRRIDYVSKNIETLEKQLESAEQKLAAASVVLNPDVRDEDGLPITDIVEQLDDDDKVTSYRLQKPGDMQPQIQEALAKAGIKDIPEGSEVEGAPPTGSVEEIIEEIDDEDPPAAEQDDEREKAPQQAKQEAKGLITKSESKPEPGSQQEQPNTKKGVSFADDTKPGHDPSRNGNQPISRTAQRLEEIMQQARQQAIPSENPVMPDDESEEDAQLRREMLRYGMSEIAPIVAALEIDEESGSEIGDAYDEEEDDDDDKFEDEHGRYTYRVVDDDYRARMEELERKLGIKSTRELEAQATDDGEEDEGVNGEVRDEGIARIAVQPQAPSRPVIKTEDKPAEAKPAKKGVKFASAVDVAPVASKEPLAAVEEPVEPFVDPMKTTIVERGAAPPPSAPTSIEPKKVSRFKKVKAATANAESLPVRSAPTVPKGPADAPARFLGREEVRIAPSGPEGKTLAGTVLERDTPAEVKEPDEFDAALLHQEAATEYHRMRNRMILKEGGFMRNKEAPIEYPEDEENGKPISRFKAARLARQ